MGGKHHRGRQYEDYVGEDATVNPTETPPTIRSYEVVVSQILAMGLADGVITADNKDGWTAFAFNDTIPEHIRNLHLAELAVSIAQNRANRIAEQHPEAHALDQLFELAELERQYRLPTNH